MKTYFLSSTIFEKNEGGKEREYGSSLDSSWPVVLLNLSPSHACL